MDRRIFSFKKRTQPNSSSFRMCAEKRLRSFPAVYKDIENSSECVQNHGTVCGVRCMCKSKHHEEFNTLDIHIDIELVINFHNDDPVPFKHVYSSKFVPSSWNNVK